MQKFYTSESVSEGHPDKLADFISDSILDEFLRQEPGSRVAVGGMLICRQMPPTAKGFCFLSLEDETGIANLVVPPDAYARFRKDIHGALFLVGQGTLEKTGKVMNVKVQQLEPIVSPVRV